MIEDLFKDMDFSSVFDNLIDFLEGCRIKLIYRKYRGVHRKSKRRYIYFYNPVINELILPNISSSLRILERINYD